MLKNSRDGCEAVNDAYLPARNRILKRYLCTVIRNNTITNKSEALCIDGLADIAVPDKVGAAK